MGRKFRSSRVKLRFDLYYKDLFSLEFPTFFLKYIWVVCVGFNWGDFRGDSYINIWPELPVVDDSDTCVGVELHQSTDSATGDELLAVKKVYQEHRFGVQFSNTYGIVK